MSLFVAAIGATVTAIFELTVGPYLRVGNAQPHLVFILAIISTVAVGLARYARGWMLGGRDELTGLVVPMGLGSIVGAIVGGALVPYVPPRALKLLLSAILVGSAVRVFRHAD